MMGGLKLARVVGVHPDSNAVDLVFLDDGSRVPMVQVTCGVPSSSSSGVSGMPSPVVPDGEGKWEAELSGDRDMVAVCGFFRGLPIVLGFLFPQVSEMLFADRDRVVNRSPSDFYTTVDGAGNFEAYHPSGTYLRIAENPEHEDLTGKDADGKWGIRRNTGRAPSVRLVVGSGGATMATVSIAPSGSVSVSSQGGLSIETVGDIGLKAGGDMNLEAGGNVNIDSAGLNHNGTNVGDSHTHGGVSTGGGSTQPPN